MIFKNIAE